MQTLTPFAAILILAFLAESLTEYFARPVIHAFPTGPAPQAPGNPVSPLWLRYIAALVGIGLAIAYRADVLAMAGLVAWSPWVGYVITGIIIGRGSNYLHDLADRWLAPTPKAPTP